MRLLVAVTLLLIAVALGGCYCGPASYSVGYGVGYCEPVYCPPPPPCGVVVTHGHCGW